MTAKNHSAPAADLLRPEQMADMAMAHQATPTGFEPLDHVLDGGFLPEELVVLGGRPGVGKTISLIQWARHQAQHGQHVLLAHYEHSPLTVLVQLMLIEIGEFASDVEVSSKARHDLADLVGGRRSWPDVVSSNETIAQAYELAGQHAERLHIMSRESLRDGINGLRDALSAHGGIDVVMVDHLAKVPDRMGISGRPGETAEILKADAVHYGHVAIVSATVSDAGIGARKLRMGHLEESALVGHEADVVVLLCNKIGAVSRSHSAFDSVRADGFRNQVIFTVEKNRRGMAAVDMEFSRDFAHRRFVSQGGFVSEVLVDDVLVRD